MERTEYEIAMLEVRQTLKDFLKDLKVQNCIPISRYRKVSEQLTSIEEQLRQYRDHSKAVQII